MTSKFGSKHWSWFLVAVVAIGGVVAFAASAAITRGVVSAYNDTGSSPCKWRHADNTLLRPKWENHPYLPAGQCLWAGVRRCYG